MLLTIAHTFAYALIQTFGFSIFTLALQAASSASTASRPSSSCCS
jgi:hypothetical protein